MPTRDGETILFYPVELRSASIPAGLEPATWSIWSDVVSPGIRQKFLWGKDSDDKVDHDAFLQLLYQLSYLLGSRVGLEPTTNGVMRAFIEKGIMTTRGVTLIRRSGFGFEPNIPM